MKKSKGLLKFMFTLALVITMNMMSTNSAFASNVDYTSVISTFVQENAEVQSVNGDTPARAGTSAWESVKDYFSTSSKGADDVAIVVSANGGTTTWHYSKAQQETIANKASIGTIADTDSKINEAMGSVNVHADTAGAADMMSGLIPIVNIVVGLVVSGVILLLGLYTGFDIMFLAFPIFRTFSEGQLQNGKSNVMVKKNSNGEARYRFISDDAVRAYKESIVDGGNKQPYLKYIISRSWAYIALAVIVTMFITGHYDVFIKIGIRIGEGFINLVSKTGKIS